MSSYKIKKISFSKFIKNNKKNFFRLVLSSLISLGLFKGINYQEKSIFDDYEVKVDNAIENTVIQYQDTIINSSVPDSLVAVGNLGYGNNYVFKNRILYDEDNNVVDLTGDSRTLYFNGANIDKESLELMNLNKSCTEAVILSSSSITDDCIKYLPSTVRCLSLKRCNFLTDLSELPNYCPNIEVLYLNNTNLNTLDFIYELPKLKKLEASETLCVTEELLDYLHENDIVTDITDEDIRLQEKLENIKNSIITEDMSEEERIQAICLYVLNNLEYDIDLSIQSNENPITLACLEGKGVCVSYAHLLDALLSISGIESYRIDNMSHAWNLVKLGERYYYIDPTTMDGDSKLYNFLLTKFNIDKGYMFDPTLSNMDGSTTVIDSDLTIIPSELEDDVLKQNVSTQKYNYSFNPTVCNLLIMRFFILGFASIQGYSTTKNIVNSYKKLTLKES